MVEAGLVSVRKDEKGKLIKELGELSNDIKKDGLIINGYFLAPKTYGTRYINCDGKVRADKIAAKGMPNAKNKDFVEGLDQEEENRFTNLNYVDFKEGRQKRVSFSTCKKTHWENRESDEAYTIRWNETHRTFLKSEWCGWDFDGVNRWYPHGYISG